MLSLGSRELRGKAKKELIEIMKKLHEWNEKYNKEKKERYLSIFHLGDDWNVYTSSATGANYFDYTFDDVELEEEM